MKKYLLPLFLVFLASTTIHTMEDQNPHERVKQVSSIMQLQFSNQSEKVASFFFAEGS